jgi:uncharacterized protein
MIEELIPETPPGPTTAPFWEAAARHRFVLQRCASCGKLQHPPEPICTACLSDSLEFEEVSGLGKVYSFTVVRRALLPELQSHVPYVLGLIDLAEECRIVSLIRGCAPEEVHIGLAVRVDFETVGPLTLPVFTPIGRAASSH